MKINLQDLIDEGEKSSISIKVLNQNSLQIAISIPSITKIFNGFIILLSESKFTQDNFPINGTKYEGSSVWNNPSPNSGMIGNSAQVVVASYGYFNDDISTRLFTINNIDTNKIYYANLHICSNILQYHTNGVRSYVEEQYSVNNDSTYAGSIKAYSEPPLNPKNGQPYYDLDSGYVYIWNSLKNEWLKSASEVIETGTEFPINKNQLFFNTLNNKLYFFNGQDFVECNNTNARIKINNSYFPLLSTQQAFSLELLTPTSGELVFYKSANNFNISNKPEIKVSALGTWFELSSNIFEVLNGTWIKVHDNVNKNGNKLPTKPNVSDFFYNITNGNLYSWDGDKWNRADLEEDGVPTYDKINIGSSGSNVERENLISILQTQLGAPVRCTELLESHYNIAINNALKNVRIKTDQALERMYLPFTLTPQQQVYYLNDPRFNTNKIVNLVKIHRLSILGLSSTGNLDDTSTLLTQNIMNQLFVQKTLDGVSLFMFEQLGDMYNRLLAGEYSFTFNEAKRQLFIHKNIVSPEKVLLDCYVERQEQELLNDRYLQQWIQNWALAECFLMLGNIRTKYSSLPGPNGGITMNGDSLISRANEMFTELKRQVSDFELGGGTDYMPIYIG